MIEHSEKVGWRVSEWANATGMKRTSVYKLMMQPRSPIRSVKVGGVRIIVTPPREFLERLASEEA